MLVTVIGEYLNFPSSKKNSPTVLPWAYEHRKVTNRSSRYSREPSLIGEGNIDYVTGLPMRNLSDKYFKVWHNKKLEKTGMTASDSFGTHHK